MWTRRRERRTPRLAWVAVVAAMAVLAAACGSERTEGVASVGQGEGTASRSGQQGQQDAEQRAKDPEKAMLDFARCMRDHGVDMPDPKPGEGAITRFEAPSDGAPLPDQSKFVEADKACRHLMGDAGPPDLSPEDQKEMQDAMLAFTRCMRDHGVDVPDPQPGGAGVLAKVGEGTDPRSPQFQAAEKECRKHMEAVDKKLGVTRSEG